MSTKDEETPIELSTPPRGELNEYLLEGLSKPASPIHGHCLLIMKVFDTRGPRAFAKSIDYTITRNGEHVGN